MMKLFKIFHQPLKDAYFKSIIDGSHANEEFFVYYSIENSQGFSNIFVFILSQQKQL